MSVPLKVLLIEDSEDDAWLILRELRRGGFSPEHERVDSRNGLLEALDRQTWDIVLSDYVVPGFGGLEALAIIKQKRLDLPFILVSGKIGEEIAVEAMRAGAHDYVLKNNLTRLALAVRRELSESEVRRRRRQAEEALRRSEEHFRSLIENASDIITVLNVDGTIRYESPSVERVLGYRPADLEGQKAFQYVHPEDAPKIISAYSRAIQDPRARLTAEFRVRHKDGSWHILESTGDVLLDASGAVSLVVNSRDMTERRQLEAQLAESQKVEAFGRLAGAMAQDFNNLMTAILGYTELVLDQTAHEPGVRQNVLEIQRAGQRAAAFAQQLTAVSRKEVFAPVDLDLNAFLASLSRRLKDVVGDGIDVVLLLAPDAETVRVDAAQMEQVVMTLAAHAREALGRGSRLVIQTAGVSLEEIDFVAQRALEPGPYVRLSVQYRSDGKVKVVGGAAPETGENLNMAVLHGIVKQNGGSFHIERGREGGTMIKIYLPRVQDLGSGETLRPRREAAPSGRVVLVVEYEESVRRLLQGALSQQGYKVLAAGTGPEAFRVCKRHKGPVHLLLTNVLMPGISGPDLARRLQGSYPEMKVIYMTANDQEMAGEDVPYLRKPFTLSALARKTFEVLAAPREPMAASS
jgi:two-component system, cell cycle sensor histidine kinase and response regulator CckA